jgi:predicted AlkP superfamily phosphohydrolase/phosphomutase
MSGIKAYSYGGIHVRKDGTGGTRYESVRDRIIDLIQERCVTDDGKQLLKFIARREEVYEGPQLSAYPDIVLELKYGWGVGQSIGRTLLGRSPVTSLMPGSHRRETPILLVRAGGRGSPRRRRVHMMDIAPTVLDLLGLRHDEWFDGKSIYCSHSRSGGLTGGPWEKASCASTGAASACLNSRERS